MGSAAALSEADISERGGRISAMHRRIPKVLSKAEVKEIRRRVDAGEFVAGNLLVGGAAGEVKNNLQLREDSPAYKEVVPTIMRKVAASQELSGFVFPKTMLPPLISRYEPGMTYGTHVDAPFFRKGDLRSDVSMTLFLSEPDEYAGGELVIEQGGNEVPVKLEAGDAFVYPTTYLHRVAPVTEGARVAAVSWFQSFVRNERHREIAAQLGQVKQRLDREPELAKEADLLRAALYNLLREWWTP
jgi:PKHD-type hydroxylase